MFYIDTTKYNKNTLLSSNQFDIVCLYSKAKLDETKQNDVFFEKIRNLENV